MTDWMTIRVVLAGQPDAPLPQPPGRTMLAHADHSFADLAEAVDTAFARWDLTPLHQFEVEGRLLLPAEAAGEDPEAEASDEVTVGEVGLRTGARFTYVFDLGEQWTHDCVVEEVGLDPFEAAGEEPEVPVPVFGWGTIPDQYGRLAEDDDEGDAATGGRPWSEGDVDGDLDEDDDYADEDDDYADAEDYGEDDDDYGDDEDYDEDWPPDAASAWPVVRDALAAVERHPDRDALAAATASLRARAGEAGRPEQILWAASGLDAAAAPAGDEDLWVGLAAGMIAPVPDASAEAEALAAADALEPADWAGAVIEIVRAGPGVEVTPAWTLEAIARCPEVEENDLTDESEALLLRGLEVVTGLWQALGVLDGDGRLTTLGHWGLPEALRRAWERGQGSGEPGDRLAREG